MVRHESVFGRARSSSSGSVARRLSPFLPKIELLEGRELLTSYTLEILEPLNISGPEVNSANGINESGKAVGFSRNSVASQWNPGSTVAIDLGFLAEDAGSVANQINDSGRSVGKSSHGQDPGEITHAVWWEDGPAPIAISSPLGVRNTQAFDINNAGRIIGSYKLFPSGSPRGFRTDAPYTTLVQLDPLSGHTGSRVKGNNNNAMGGGDTVGVSIVSQADQTAVIWRGLATTPTALAASGGVVEKPMIANALNDLSPPLIVGKGSTVGGDNESQAVFWLGVTGAVTAIGVLPGYVNSEAFGVNNAGQIVGYASNPSTPTVNRAFIFKDGVLENLNDKLCPGQLNYPSEWLDSAYDINDSGQIVGGAYIHLGPSIITNRAYRLTPVESCGPVPLSPRQQGVTPPDMAFNETATVRQYLRETPLADFDDPTQECTVEPPRTSTIATARIPRMSRSEARDSAFSVNLFSSLNDR